MNCILENYIKFLNFKMELVFNRGFCKFMFIVIKIIKFVYKVF